MARTKRTPTNAEIVGFRNTLSARGLPVPPDMFPLRPELVPLPPDEAKRQSRRTTSRIQKNRARQLAKGSSSKAPAKDSSCTATIVHRTFQSTALNMEITSEAMRAVDEVLNIIFENLALEAMRRTKSKNMRKLTALTAQEAKAAFEHLRQKPGQKKNRRTLKGRKLHATTKVSGLTLGGRGNLKTSKKHTQ